jgi:serine/threonine protein kinase
VSATKKKAPSKEQTPRQFGPFVLERRIAVGGTAEVYHARPRQGARPAPELVIKRLLPGQSDADHFKTLSREAELHRAVRHENVVTVFGAGMVGDEPYLAMEYVPGVDLHRLLRSCASEQRQLEPGVAAYIAHAVALALDAVHSARDDKGVRLNLTHGDVSPSNIYLSLSGEVKLGDFGVAHTALEISKGRRESVEGKFGYVAPEQLAFATFDHRSDIFALGVVLGEMLIGERVFPGNGQLAVLLSIREANIEPLRRAAERLPKALFAACERALAREPEKRFADAGAFADCLRSELKPADARAALAKWVLWARDTNVFARQFEQRVRNASGANWATDRGDLPDGLTEMSSIRRAGVVTHTAVSFSALLEMAATGQLYPDDEVSLMGDAFREVSAIDELSRYLMPSTATTTAQLFEPGVPDFTAELSETPMLQVLARMRMRRESGALFVARNTQRGIQDRKDMYLADGRLVHVASSDREELLGRYALRLGLISEEELELALGNLASFGGRLGDTLIGLGLAEPTAVFRAIRNQGRDRVAALCPFQEGRVQFYRGSEAAHVQFPLDLDLTVPMMAGAMLMARQGPDPLASVQRLHPGRRRPDADSSEERGDAPRCLISLLELVQRGPSIPEVINAQLEGTKGEERPTSEREARAAIQVALALEWVRAE